MARKSYEVSIFVDVHDARDLYEAALARGVAENSDAQNKSRRATIAHFRDYLGTRKAPDVHGCLRMMFDPGLSPDGCTINDSAVS